MRVGLFEDVHCAEAGMLYASQPLLAHGNNECRGRRARFVSATPDIENFGTVGSVLLTVRLCLRAGNLKRRAPCAGMN